MFYLTIGILTRNIAFRTYDAQAKAETGVANPPRALASSLSPRRTSVPLSRAVPSYMMGRNSNPIVSGPTVPLYSNVVVPRTPSLQEETTALVSAHRCSSEDIESTSQFEPDRSNRSSNETLFIVSSRDSNNGSNRLTSSKAGFLLEYSGDDLAIVNHKCVHSPRVGSKERTRNASKEIVHVVHAPTIKAKERLERVFEPEAAVKSLSAIEKQEWMLWLRLRKKSLAIRGRSSSTRRDASGSSKLKRHGINTRKGQANITHIVNRDSESLNIRLAAQMLAAALNSLVIQWNEKANKSMSSERNLEGEKTHLCDRFYHLHTSTQLEEPAKSSPAARSANNNYFGVVLQFVGCRPSRFTPLQKHPSSTSNPRSSMDIGESNDGSESSLSDSIVNDYEFNEPTNLKSGDCCQWPRRCHGNSHG